VPARPLAVLAALLLAPSAWRAIPASAPLGCAPEGRGAAPRHWVGCADDPGARRPLSAAERLAVGLPIDLNAATAEELASIPGLGPRLAGEVVAERTARGPWGSVDGLLRVRGIGPARLERARPYLVAGLPASR
jgi:competence protein ComEA